MKPFASNSDRGMWSSSVGPVARSRTGDWIRSPNTCGNRGASSIRIISGTLNGSSPAGRCFSNWWKRPSNLPVAEARQPASRIAAQPGRANHLRGRGLHARSVGPAAKSRLDDSCGPQSLRHSPGRSTHRRAGDRWAVRRCGGPAIVVRSGPALGTRGVFCLLLEFEILPGRVPGLRVVVLCARA